MSRSAIVIGGGVIGAACAHYLSDAGWGVTILERERFGAACSHGNCGLICPSHVLPLAEPGAIGKALKSMLSSASPFYIKPRIDFALWSWLLNFARRCNERDMLESGRALQPLLESSAKLYEELIGGGTLNCEYERHGLLFPYLNAKPFEAYAATDKLLAKEFNLPAKKLSGAELVRFEPSLKDGLAGGWFYEHDAQLRPDALMMSWHACLERKGVRILDGVYVSSLDGNKLTTQSGVMTADAFVVATGAKTPELERITGCKIPIQPGKGYSLTMPRPRICPVVPMIFPEHKVAITPFQSGYRIGSTMEFAGYDSSLNEKRLNLLKTGAALYLREPFCEPLLESWAGWRPMTYDSVPVIGFSPKFKNVLIAAGHGMLGVTLAPVTGKLVAEMLSGATPHLDPAPYRVERF